LCQQLGKENALERFISKHGDKVTGTIMCFDRVMFKGHLPLGWGEAMERLLARHGQRIKDFGRFVQGQSERVKQQAVAMAQAAGRPYVYLRRRVRKEDEAKSIARRDGIQEGLVCVLAAVEPCNTFKVAYGEGRPQLVSAPRKCLCLYFYWIDRELGWMHVRIQTWFPLTIQVCINGHDWLARKFDRHGIRYQRLDNCFRWIEDGPRAQRFADRLVKRNWPRILSAFARRVNPLLRDVLHGMDYYWVIEQAEYATDVMFRDRATLQPLYEQLLRHATLCFSAEDVMTFLGRKLHGGFQGEVQSDFTKRWPGARIKHRMKNNGIKMYDKFGCVLRVETVINRPSEFQVRRRGCRQGKTVVGYFPMAKGVANFYRYAEVSRAANARYLEALAGVADPATARQQIRKLARPVKEGRRRYRGFNPAAEDDVQLFAAVLRGEHAIHGFRNRDVRRHLFPKTSRPEDIRRMANRVSRLLRRLHAHGLIAKIPRSRRWRPTRHGQALMATTLTLHHDQYPQTLLQQAV
jgi:hypothetical protein